MRTTTNRPRLTFQVTRDFDGNVIEYFWACSRCLKRLMENLDYTAWSPELGEHVWTIDGRAVCKACHHRHEAQP